MSNLRQSAPEPPQSSRDSEAGKLRSRRFLESQEAPMTRLLLVMAIVPLLAPSAWAVGDGSDVSPYRIPEIDASIVVDGALDEPAWERALPLELAYETHPGENLPAHVSTDLYLFSSPTHLYAAFVAQDPDPSEISSNICERDRMYEGDRVVIILDTNNDQRRGYMFFCNAYGIQGDALDQRGMGAGEATWDTIWDSSGRVTEDGYVVEMAIPFSSLRFQRTEGEQVWGIGAGRRYPRDVLYSFSLSERDRDNTCYLCQVVKVAGFANATSGMNLEIDPTLTAVRTQVRNDFPHGDLEDVDGGGLFDLGPGDGDMGVTARWGITPNIVLSGTANPDFSQVEADAFQLDVNERFALWYEEKRPFFYEGMEFFDSRLHTVYTRTVADPTWGAKVTGKEGPNAFGAFVARDEVTNLIFPGSQGSSSTQLDIETTATALRYRRDVGASSVIGLIATDRRGGDYWNRCGGIDGRIQFLDSDRIEFQVMASQTEYPDDVAAEHEQRSGAFDGTSYDVEYNHASANYQWWLAYREIDDGFRSDLGYRTQTGFMQARTGVTRILRGGPGQWFSSLSGGGGYVHVAEPGGGFPGGSDGLLDSFADFWLNYNGPARSYVNVYGRLGRQGYADDEYRKNIVSASAGYWPTPDLSVGLRGAYGDQIDYSGGRNGTISVIEPVLNVRKGRLDLALAHELERLSVDEGTLYTANVTYLRGVYQFTRRAALRTVVQYMDVEFDTELAGRQSEQEEHLAGQVLFSYKVNPQTVLYMGYSDFRYGDDAADLTLSDTTFFVKLGYALIL